MNVEISRRTITRAETLYRLLLFVYPPSFRRAYGPQMAQTFRDCCRDHLQQADSFGLARLWCSILYDLTTTACLEYAKSCLALLKHLIGLEKEYAMPHLLQLDVASRTDIGLKRATNEDNAVSVVPENPQVMEEKGALFVVADGMGGHTRGEVASEIAVTTIRETYYHDQRNDLLASLRYAVEQANALICQRNQELGVATDGKKFMGTTCVAAVLKDSTVYVANAGDSLAYIVRAGQLQQISQNHSWVEEQVRTGAMTREEAEAQGKSNVIVKCLGETLDLVVYASSQPVQHGDILILCTDGLHGLVSEDEIRTIVEQYDAKESAAHLVARANENGGPDNITAVVVRVSLTS